MCSPLCVFQSATLCSLRSKKRVVSAPRQPHQPAEVTTLAQPMKRRCPRPLEPESFRFLSPNDGAMASALRDDDAGELTEKEWREMRRRMTSLQFEPVPETPELLPRSFYASEDAQEPGGEASSRDEVAQAQGDLQGEEREEVHAEEVGEVVLEETRDDWLTVDELRGAPDDGEAKLSNACSPLPKLSDYPKKRSVASPMKKARRRSSNPSENETTVVANLGGVEATISTAQDELRATIMAALRETTSRLERDAQLERRKLEAAHANRLAILQSQIEELQAQLTTREQEAQDACRRVDRTTRFLMLRKQREREVWRGPRSVHACFHMWKSRWQHKKHKHVQQHVASQFQKKQSQQILLQQWKLMTQQQAWEKKIRALKAEHQQQIDKLEAEHAALVDSMQSGLDDARKEVAVAQHGRRQLEEDLRQVFLRGVSAMNIEALTLFKTNHQIVQQRQQAESANQLQRQETERAVSSTFELDDGNLESSTSLREAVVCGGESSGELPSEERMIPLKQPVAVADDPRTQFLTLPVPVGVPAASMPSSAIANRLLKRAGSADVLSPPPPPPAAVPPTAAIHGLRSAELVEEHQRLHHATISTQTQPPLVSTSTVNSRSSSKLIPSPTQQRVQAQSSAQFHVEMEYMRSAVETTNLNARTSYSSHRPTLSSSSGVASSSRSGPTLHSASSLGIAPTRRSSSFASSSRSTWRS